MSGRKVCAITDEEEVIWKVSAHSSATAAAAGTLHCMMGHMDEFSMTEDVAQRIMINFFD